MECSICLNVISSPTKFKSIDCKHCFHEKCIKEWISHGKKTCPNCRAIINQKTLEKLNGGVVIKKEILLQLQQQQQPVQNEFIIASMDDLQAILGRIGANHD
jgi:hypothetical protein